MTASESNPLPDGAQRARALAVDQSFIVQAPAGSGKTELLIQRLLALLATVDAPEEVVAITFTRKAAGEMQQRILDALSMARSEDPPAESHRTVTWSLARAVRARSMSLNWALEENPTRFRIHTIDALCASLVRQIPMLGGPAAHCRVTNDPGVYYLEAARRTLDLLGDGGAWGSAIGKLLLHLDNDFAATESLLVRMLERRDQWLRRVLPSHSDGVDRDALERSLQVLIADHLQTVRAQFPMQCQDELLALAKYAANNLIAEKRDSAIIALAEMSVLPGVGHQDCPLWDAVAEFLLTKEGAPRRKVDVTVGFPTSQRKAERATFDQFKQRMLALLGELQPDSRFVQQLHAVRQLPPAHYSDGQWLALGALIEVLPLLVAQLDLVFRERRCVDFSAIAMSALNALGNPDEPTDLALTLDYRIRHILVDEFQDTSQTQFDLIERLTAGWSPGDGRTLFVVGDPMQSIYRFREAEVALFLQARAFGIGSVILEPLQLSANFRAQTGLVDWVNAAFSRLLPEEDEISAGAIAFAHSQAVRPSLPGKAVHVHAFAGSASDIQANRVVDIAESLRRDFPTGSIAVLVSSRKHLTAILPALKRGGHAVHAVEIESLASRPTVLDLVSLTCALLHPADRIAWLSILRAPWCGVQLADLEIIGGPQENGSDVNISDAMRDASRIELMSEDGRVRVGRMADVLARHLPDRQRMSMRNFVERVWISLGGAATCGDGDGLSDAVAFFELLEEMELEGGVLDGALLVQRIARLYSQASSAEHSAIQVMTIHKAKGLEFDAVILPGLGYRRAQDSQQLLRWLERPRAHGRPDLVLAPIGFNRESQDPIYRALSKIEKNKARHEELRLLYVAATRARKTLHLIGHTENETAPGRRPIPAPGALLAALWPVVEPDFSSPESAQPAQLQESVTALSRMRLATDWNLPAPMPTVLTQSGNRPSSQTGKVQFDWASETARKVGTVVHRALQRIAQDGVESWPSQRVDLLLPALEGQLRAAGIQGSEMGIAIRRASEAIRNAIGDARGYWVLKSHTDARCEWRLTGVIDSEIVTVSIDRSFIDEHGVRWVIDFKTSVHEGSDLPGFLASEQARYQDQLERYALLIRNLGDRRPIRLALYFPIMREWREWNASVPTVPPLPSVSSST